MKQRTLFAVFREKPVFVKVPAYVGIPQAEPAVLRIGLPSLAVVPNERLWMPCNCVSW